MKNLFAIICLFVYSNIYSQDTCDFKEYYLEFLSVEIMTFDDKKVSILKTKKPDNSFCFYPVLKDSMYVNYLSKSLLKLNEVEEHFIQSKNQEELNKRFFQVLKKDTLFNHSLNELISKTILGHPKDTVSMNQLLNYAVKFFSVSLNDDGNYKGKICIGGMRDIEKLHAKRNFHLEAFSFSSIFKHLLSKEKKYDFQNEWRKAVTEIATVSLGLDDSEKVLRAEGALYLLMKTNENLKNMLLEEYELKKELLPFYLTNN